MLAGNEREALLDVTDRLSLELGYAEGGEIPGGSSPLAGSDGPMSGLLDSEDELFVAQMRSGLAKIAAALGATQSGGPREGALCVALDGAEGVMRGELLSGNARQLPALMPAFVFLVVLTVSDQDKALAVSRRAGELVDRTLD